MEHLGWGLQISALGMGLVFGLLALLWALLTLVLRLDAPPQSAGAGGIGPAVGVGDEGEGEGERPGAAALAVVDDASEAALVAAITLAVLTHDALQRKEAAPAARAHWPGSLLHASRWVASGRLRQNRTFRRGR